jgi:hypothetical protein
MSDDDEYQEGLAGSELSPESKKRLRKFEAPTKRLSANGLALPSASVPSKEIKKSTVSKSRELEQIRAGEVPAPRKKKGQGRQLVAAVVEVEEKEEESDNESESDGEEEEHFALDDEAIGAKVEADANKVKRHKERKKRKQNPKGRKKTSVVHVMFAKTDISGEFKCLLSEYVSGKHSQIVKCGHGTSNLVLHARQNHQEVFEALVKAYNDRRNVRQEFDGLVKALKKPTKQGQTCLNDYFGTCVKASEIGFRRELSLLAFVVECSLPFSVIDSLSFEQWMHELGVQLPSEGTIFKLLDPLYQFIVGFLEKRIQECGFFSVTFDMWTSVAKHKYLVTTYHAISEDFKMISAPLDLIPLSCSAYGEFIATAIDSRISQHNLSECVFMASFSDSGSNCVLAKGILTPGDEEPCFHHNLKHMIDDVIGAEPGQKATNVAAALDFTAVGLLIAIVRGSSVLRKELEGASQKENLPDLELIAANLTRWEGRYLALQRFLELAAALKKMDGKGLFEQYRKKSPASFPEDFLEQPFLARLDMYRQILERLFLISKAGQSQSEPTLSCVPHWTWQIEELLTVLPDDGPSTCAFKNDLLGACKQRLSVFVDCAQSGVGEFDVLPNTLKAALLDPRHSHEVQARLSNTCICAVRDAIIADTLLLFESEELRETLEHSMKQSFKMLLTELNNAALNGMTCLQWWAELQARDAKRGHIFSNFFLSARVFLSMPAGGSPSECVFSSTTDMVTKKRNRLGDDTLEKMTVVRHFLKSRFYNFDDLANEMIRTVKSANDGLDLCE